MKLNSFILLGATLVSTIILFLLHFKVLHPPGYEREHFIQIMRNQNATIAMLIKSIESKGSRSITGNGNSANVEVANSPMQQPPIVSIPKMNAASSIIDKRLISTDFEMSCENRFGLSLVDLWKESKEDWCEGGDSSLQCYPYHQNHKRLDGRGPDMFCEARNLIMDFSKITGTVPKHKQAMGQQYLGFLQGSLLGSCSKTKKFRPHIFMPHHRLQMESFQSDATISTPDLIVDTTTYLLARDEDCENTFHSTADFMNAFLVLSILGLDPADQQVMLFDAHPDGPYSELISKAFSPNHHVLRHTHYAGKTVKFKRLIFHLESPAGLIFPKVALPDPMRCHSVSLFQAYRRFILKAFDLLDVPPPPIPTVTLTLRHRTEHKNVGRVMANEAEIIDVLRTGNLISVHVVDFAKMTFGEQLRQVRSSNVLVGIHGAGLMMIMFAAEEAVLVEIHPSYRLDRHFRHAARMAGKIYMPMRVHSTPGYRETCEGSSDNVKVPVDEFTKTIDGAIRLARSFDDGLSECGLVCPPELLAVDPRLEPHYRAGAPRVRPIDTRFPCHR